MTNLFVPRSAFPLFLSYLLLLLVVVLLLLVLVLRLLHIPLPVLHLLLLLPLRPLSFFCFFSMTIKAGDDQSRRLSASQQANNPWAASEERGNTLMALHNFTQVRSTADSPR